MRSADLLSMALSALWQQKTRTLLTMLGVVFGSFVLAASLSIGEGVQNAIAGAARDNDLLRKIVVHPQRQSVEPSKPGQEVPGEMTSAKRERIRAALAERDMGATILVALTQAKLRALTDLEHVEAVVPMATQTGSAVFEGKSQAVTVASARLDSAFHRDRLIAGRFFESPNAREVVVSELLLFRWGLTDDTAVNEVLGKKIRLDLHVWQPETGLLLNWIKPNAVLTWEEFATLDKVKRQLPAVLDKLELTPAEKQMLRKAVQEGQPNSMKVHSEEFTLVGVLRLPDNKSTRGQWDPLRTDADFLLPVQTATDLFFRVPLAARQDREGVDQAVVIVDREENVKEVSQRIRAMGFLVQAPLEFIERERLIYLMIFGAMTFIAAVALVVAALGIANTMLMSVLERTREIGIMKAVGAGNGHLQLIFLVEGALIGLVGGGLGLALAWGASFPADTWVRSMVSRDLHVDLKESLFAFPPWLVAAAPLFAVLVTTLAAVYPARRAARVDPVAALRHE